MKRSFFLPVFCLAFLLGVPGLVKAQTQTKLAHVDYQAVMLSLPERAEAEKKVQAFAKRLESEIKEMNTEYQSRLTEFQQNQETMTETERQSEMDKLSNLQQRISQAQQKAQEDLQKQEQELLEPMFARVDSLVQKMAEEEGYTYVFDSSTLLYAGGKDLTPLIKERLTAGGSAGTGDSAE